jgi:hypothetical protein
MHPGIAEENRGPVLVSIGFAVEVAAGHNRRDKGQAMIRRQYAFNPPVSDPRHEAEMLWDEMRDELRIARDALEVSEAREVANASLIDMLRKELAATKTAHRSDQVALTVMRTKLESAGRLVLDALKLDEPEKRQEPAQQPTPQSVQTLETARPPKPPVQEIVDDDDPEKIISSITKLHHKWP